VCGHTIGMLQHYLRGTIVVAVTPSVCEDLTVGVRREVVSGICHCMTERLPALCRQATALARIALVLADKYRHLAGTESIRLTHQNDPNLSCILISPSLISGHSKEGLYWPKLSMELSP
jgi:hypothetical protein